MLKSSVRCAAPLPVVSSVTSHPVGSPMIPSGFPATICTGDTWSKSNRDANWVRVWIYLSVHVTPAKGDTHRAYFHFSMSVWAVDVHCGCCRQLNYPYICGRCMQFRVLKWLCWFLNCRKRFEIFLSLLLKSTQIHFSFHTAAKFGRNS